MARIHARKRGKSGSKRPSTKISPRWVRYKKDEVEKLVVKMTKQEHSSAKIGLLLRDVYGIPSVRNLTGKTVTQIMKENNAYPKFPEDLFNLMLQSVKLRDHLTRFKKDYTSKRGLELLESKIRRLGKYYSREGVIDPKWKYDPEKAKIFVQQR